MLTDRCCNDCVSFGRMQLEIRQVFQYIINGTWIRDRSIVVQVVVIKIPLFDNRCDNS